MMQKIMGASLRRHQIPASRGWYLGLYLKEKRWAEVADVVRFAHRDVPIQLAAADPALFERASPDYPTSLAVPMFSERRSRFAATREILSAVRKSGQAPNRPVFSQSRPFSPLTALSDHTTMNGAIGVAGTSSNSNAVGAPDTPFADAEAEALRGKMNELLRALRR